MFASAARYIFTELNFVKRSPEWITCRHRAIRESSVGHPIPYPFYPASSGNLIRHAYHVASFEEKTQCKTKDIDFVFEFGGDGGYGSMCRLFYNAGFHGKYVIFDLPPFSALQVYFLKTLGLPVQSEFEFLE